MSTLLRRMITDKTSAEAISKILKDRKYDKAVLPYDIFASIFPENSRNGLAPELNGVRFYYARDEPWSSKWTTEAWGPQHD